MHCALQRRFYVGMVCEQKTMNPIQVSPVHQSVPLDHFCLVEAHRAYCVSGRAAHVTDTIVAMSVIMNTVSPLTPQEDSFLFQAPDDLICPIMHTVMRNPVITEVGTMYEEAAIRNHLARSNKDPLSNQPISDDLRPVYLLRSKAKEYATNAARRCIERDGMKGASAAVLDPECDAPAKYLRRACDVSEEAEVLGAVPNLSPKIVTFALQHRSSMHDIFLLIHFATDLASSGNKSGALSLFGNILRLWTGTLDQTAVIKRCLKFCWLESPDDDPAPSSSTPGLPNSSSHNQRSQVESQQPSGDGLQLQRSNGLGTAQQRSSNQHPERSMAAPADPVYNTAAILEFMHQQRGLRASEFVSILSNLVVPRKQLIRICKGVLSRHAPADNSSADVHSVFATPRSTQSSHAAPPQSAHSSAFGELPTTDLGLDGIEHSSDSVAAVTPATSFARSPLPNTPLFNQAKVQHSGAGRSVTGGAHIRQHSGQLGGLHYEPSLAQVSHVNNAAEQHYTELSEALALVPRLMEMTEAELREESAARVSALGHELTAALGLDMTGVADVPSVCDTREEEAPEILLLKGRAAAALRRRRLERSVAVVTTIGAVFIPGGIGRLLASVPALVVLSRS